MKSTLCGAYFMSPSQLPISALMEAMAARLAVVFCAVSAFSATLSAPPPLVYVGVGARHMLTTALAVARRYVGSSRAGETVALRIQRSTMSCRLRKPGYGRTVISVPGSRRKGGPFVCILAKV